MARPIRINRMPCRMGRNRPRTPKTMKNQPMIRSPILLIAPNDRLLPAEVGQKHPNLSSSQGVPANSVEKDTYYCTENQCLSIKIIIMDNWVTINIIISI